MTTEPLNEPELEDVDEKPRQFGLIHLMGLMSGLAFLCALAAPLYRMMEPGKQLQFLIAMVMQLIIASATALFFSYRRSETLKQAGKRIGIGYPGKLPGKYGPMIIGSLGLLAFALVQLGIALFVTSAPDASTQPLFLVQQVQLSFFAGTAMMQLVWGRSPGTTEFFENGVVIGSFSLISWEKITLRPSQFDESRIVMVRREKMQSNHQVFSHTSTLLVLEPTRSHLLARYGEAAKANEKSPG